MPRAVSDIFSVTIATDPSAASQFVPQRRGRNATRTGLSRWVHRHSLCSPDRLTGLQ